MIFEEDGEYVVHCSHDQDRVACTYCQASAATYFVSRDIPRSKWPVWMQDKFKEITKESIDIRAKENAPVETFSLLRQILKKLNNSLF